LIDGLKNPSDSFQDKLFPYPDGICDPYRAELLCCSEREDWRRFAGVVCNWMYIYIYIYIFDSSWRGSGWAGTEVLTTANAVLYPLDPET
jgi:hypothetical protein